MSKKFPKLIKKHNEIIFLTLSVVITIIFVNLFNYKKKIDNQSYNNLINNIYLKNTLNHIFDNLEPKYKRINHKIASQNFLR